MKHIIAVLCSSSLCFLFGFQQPEQQAMKQMQDNKNITKPADTPVSPQHDSANAASHFFLTRFSYTPETWARLMKNPEDRRVAARQVHRVSRREAARLLVRIRSIRRLLPLGSA